MEVLLQNPVHHNPVDYVVMDYGRLLIYIHFIVFLPAFPLVQDPEQTVSGHLDI